MGPDIGSVVSCALHCAEGCERVIQPVGPSQICDLDELPRGGFVKRRKNVVSL